MSTSTLSNDELNEAVARAMPNGVSLGDEETAIVTGCQVRGGTWLRDPRHRPDERHEWGQYLIRVPDFSTSIDALAEPEQLLRDAGWWLEATTHPRWASAMWVPPAPAYYMPRVVAPTEARARAEACLDALKALGEVQK